MVNSLYEDAMMPSRIDYPVTAALQQDKEEQMARMSKNTWETVERTINEHGQWIQYLGYLLAFTLIGAAALNIIKKSNKKNKQHNRRSNNPQDF